MAGGYTPPVTRRASLVLLGVLGVGVFLAGMELMITAVALPSIIVHFSEQIYGAPDWRVLRAASWVVNGYLLVYVVTMPLAGRLADIVGARRLVYCGLVLFAVGSALAGAAQTLEQLVAARLLQAAGGGTLVPVATAAASHLFEGHARPRALGVVGALTFLGMAAGPFAGAAILERIHPEVLLAALDPGADPSVAPAAAFLAPAWRWVFYVNVPVGIAALALAWAVSAGWETPRRAARVDLAGGALVGLGLGALLVGLTLTGSSPGPGDGGPDPAAVARGALLVGGVATVLAVASGLRRRDPFLDPRLFRRPAFAGAALVSLITGYGLATAIVGGAVFVDRVLYGGPGDQQVALGTLAGATAAGALAAGFVARHASLRLVTLVGLALSVAALARMGTWPGREVDLAELALVLGAFGAGFGLTVTPRSTAAVEAAGRAAFGAASATVTVARMIGMAVGLAILTSYGSSTIDRLAADVYATPDAYRRYIPEDLRDRSLDDGLVVDALETWASDEAARILEGIFLAAAGVTLLAVPPALVLGGRPRILTGEGVATATAPGAEGGEGDGEAGTEPTLAL
jgi:MFS family permease